MFKVVHELAPPPLRGCLVFLWQCR